MQYVLDFLRQVKAKAPDAFERVQYIEQPTARDLAANRQNTMFEAAKLRPVVIDESLTDLETLLLAREMGYTGVALKACKGQSQTAADGGRGAEVQDVPLRAGSDLPGRGAGAFGRHRGARSGYSAVEANAREYVPAANAGWEKKFPGIFDVRDGWLKTTGLNGPGLCLS